MDEVIRKRLTWVRLYHETGDAGYVCRHCGISRPTLRKWLERYEAAGEDGLRDQSKRPRTLARQKISSTEEEWLLALRNERGLGVRRIQHELRRLHQFTVSLSTIHAILARHDLSRLRAKRTRHQPKRYEKAVPGERVQLDTCKIAPGLYQYTAIDDCSRFLVLAVFPTRSATNTLQFLEQVCEETPFPVQCVQTDQGTEFTAYKVQELLLDWHIKWRPNRPRAPHLNGKVERVQRTVLEEFWSRIDITRDPYADLLGEYQFEYNWFRVHSALGKPPIDRVVERSKETLWSDDVWDAFDVVHEAQRLREQWAREAQQRRGRVAARDGHSPKTAPGQGPAPAQEDDARSATTSSPSGGSRSP
jgi:transposase InsO family protein